MVPAMAKMSTICERCDGKFDGTPSGWKKHEQTNKHNLSKPIPGDGLPDALRATLVLETDIEAPAGDEFPEDAPPEARAVMAKAVNVLADVEEARTSLKLADFDPYTLPSLPEDRREALAAAHVQIDPANTEVAKYKRYVRHGELHNLKLLPKYQAQLEAAQLRLAEANEAIEGIEQEREQLYHGHYDRVEAYWGRVHNEALKVVAEIEPLVALADLRLDRTELIVDFKGAAIQVIGPRYSYRAGTDWERIVYPAFVRVNSTFEGAPVEALVYADRIRAAGRYALTLNDVLGLA